MSEPWRHWRWVKKGVSIGLDQAERFYVPWKIRIQVAFFLPQLVQLLRSDETGMIRAFLLGSAQRSIVFAHHLVCTLKVETTLTSVLLIAVMIGIATCLNQLWCIQQFNDCFYWWDFTTDLLQPKCFLIDIELYHAAIFKEVHSTICKAIAGLSRFTSFTWPCLSVVPKLFHIT